MALSRISTVGQNRYIWSQVQDTQKRLNDLTEQVSSGKNARHASGIADNYYRSSTYENALERNTELKASIGSAKLRLTEMETTTRSIVDRVGEFRSTLVRAASATNQGQIDLAKMGKDFYNEIAAYLNAEQEDRYLFGGSLTGDKPVKNYDEMMMSFRQILQDTDGDGISDYTPPNSLANLPVAYLDTDQLARHDAVDPDTGHAIREMQIIDFFTGDQTFGSLERSVDGYLGRNSLIPHLVRTDGNGNVMRDFNGTPIGGTLLGGVGPPDGTNSVQPFDFRKLYFNGDVNKLGVQSEDNRLVDYGVTADRKGFEMVLAAAALLSLPDANPPIDLYNNALSGGGGAAGTQNTIDEQARIEAAMKLFEDSVKDTDIDNVVAIRSEIGNADVQLDESLERLRTFDLFYENAISEIENVDPAKAATLLAQNKLILESSYLAIRNLGALSLLDFIR